MRSIVKDKSKLVAECEEVPLEEGLSIIDQLEESLGTDGIGLAANQIGINKKVCIVRVPEEVNGQTEIFGHNFINPKVVELSEPIMFLGEGCLSFPGKFIETIRYNRVKVWDSLEDGIREFTGLVGVCVQHEIDHLYGKTMYESTLDSIGRNGRCPCRSGKKFKKCCLPKVL